MSFTASQAGLEEISLNHLEERMSDKNATHGGHPYLSTFDGDSNTLLPSL